MAVSHSPYAFQRLEIWATGISEQGVHMPKAARATLNDVYRNDWTSAHVGH
jgi:hypothetical protein